MFQPEQNPLTFLNSPLSSDVSDIAYPSPLSNSSTSEAPVSNPQQQHYIHTSCDMLNLAPLATISDSTLESLLQEDMTSSDIKLDLG